MSISQEDLQNAITTAFPNADIVIKDLAGDNDHWSVEIKDKAFEGLSRINQHKLVQKSVANYDIHALQIKTSY